MRVLRGGLNFIPGGIQQAGKKQDKGKKDGSGGEDEDEEESELSARPMFRADSRYFSSISDNVPSQYGLTLKI